MFKILNTTNTPAEKIVNLHQVYKSRYIMRKTQKFPELVKKMYLKYLYKFETLVPFKGIPL